MNLKICACYLYRTNLLASFDDYLLYLFDSLLFSLKDKEFIELEKSFVRLSKSKKLIVLVRITEKFE